MAATAFARTTRSLALDSSRTALAALAIAGLLLLAWSIWFFASRVTLYEISRQARLEVGTAASDVATIQSGRLASSKLAIGRQVRAGEVLVELDATEARLRLADAERRLRDYPLRLASIDREIGALEAADQGDRAGSGAALRSAEAHLRDAETAAQIAGELARRQLADAEAGGISRAEALKAVAEAKRAAASRDAAAQEARRAGFDSDTRSNQNRARIEELNQARLALQGDQEATAGTIAQLRTDIANRRVVAPADGVIAEAMPLRTGAVIGAGQRLATIVPRSGLVIVADFDPASAMGRIRPGQSATLRLAGYPWQQYGYVTATVERVAGELRDGRLRVELRATSSQTHGVKLAHGLQGEVEVAVERLSPASLLVRSLGGTLW